MTEPLDSRLDEDDAFDFDGSWKMGEKLIEICDRVKTAHQIVPGAVGQSHVSIDGVWFEVSVRIVPEEAVPGVKQ